MVLENWLALSFRLRPFSAGTFDVAAATGFSTCKHKTDFSCKVSAAEMHHPVFQHVSCSVIFSSIVTHGGRPVVTSGMHMMGSAVHRATTDPIIYSPGVEIL